jgi:transposase
VGSTWKSFTEEYRAEAVAFVLEGGRPAAEVARDIGCHEDDVRGMGAEGLGGTAAAVPAGAPLEESERAELVRLRTELKDADATVAELRMQVEFAKKVATWFARGKQ